jgi:hypothetical protein
MHRRCFVLSGSALVAAPRVHAIKLPANISSAGEWQPHRDAAGQVLISDYSQLPLFSTVRVSGGLTTLESARIAFQQPDYPNYNKGSSWANFISAWGGAVWNPELQEIYLQNGGHKDVSAAFTGVYVLSARSMKFGLQIGSQPANSALKYRAPGQTKPPYGMPLEPGEPGLGGYNLPLATGWPGTNHTYNQNVWIPPAIASEVGLANATRGWLYIHGNARALVNLDSGELTKLHWRNPNNPVQFLDVSYGACLLDKTTIVSPRSGTKWDRWWLGASEMTDWSKSGFDPDSSIPSFGKTLPTLQAKTKVFESAHRAFCTMAERRECVSFSANTVRTRIGQAMDSGQTANPSFSMDSYIDSIELTGDGASEFTAQNFDDQFGGTTCMLNGAGAHYDHPADCIWLLGNRKGDPLYKITGLSNPKGQWTVTKQPVTALTTSPRGTFGRMFVTQIGGAKIMVRVSDINNPIEVTRLA